MSQSKPESQVQNVVKEEFVGRSVERLEDRAILEGNSTFLDDIVLADMLHAKIFRSSVAHAVLEDVDIDAASELDGVVDAITGSDIAKATNRYGHRRSGLSIADRQALAGDRVRFMGEGIAAVVAETPYLAGDALDKISVSYDPIPAIVGVEASREAEEPIHPELQDDDDVEGNRWGFVDVNVGDVDAVFDDAPRVVSHRVTTNRPTAMPMEPHGAIADYDPGTERLTMYATTQEAHSLRSDLANVFDLPHNKIRVVQPDHLGGGFGHKLALHDHEVVAGVLAMRTGRPVKVVLDRPEEFESTWCRQPQVHDIELALDEDGTFLAIRDDITAESGAYTGLTKPGLVYASQMLASPYWIENVEVTGRCTFTNTVPSSAYRGFGFTQATIARESLIDVAASQLDIDPYEIRRRNLIADADCPTTHPMGYYLDSFGALECLELVEEAIDTSLLHNPADGHKRGLGVATAMHVSSVQRPAYTSDNGAVTVRMDEDGSVTVMSDQCPMGTGTRTSLAQIVADELGVAYDELIFDFGDTDRTPFGLGSWGSRAMVIAGSAAHAAARSLRDRLLTIAAFQMDTPKEALSIADRKVFTTEDPNRSRSLAELAYDAHYNGSHLPEGMTAGPLVVTESFDNPAPGGLDDSGRTDPAVNYPTAAHAVIVDINTETGALELLDYAVADDIGEVINPMIVEGQIQGGTVQGIGMAVGEELEYDDNGQLINGNMESYRLPLINETPQITKIFEADTTSERSPLGTKGVGESGTTVAPAAVLNGVADALGTTIDTLPLDSGRVFDLLQES